MPDIFDEVEEDLRADRAHAFLRRYGVLIVAVAVLVVAGAGGYEYWRHRQAESREKTAALFLAASRDAAPVAAGLSDARRQEAVSGYAAVAAQGGEGYRTLARLREAALKAGAGDLAGADALWTEVAADAKADQLLRDLATLQWAAHQPGTAPIDPIRARLGPLTDPTNPWRSLAMEQEALLDLRGGAADRAKGELRALANDITAPEDVRERAGALLARLGG